VTQWRLAVPKRESGQAVVEYALVLALVAAGLLIALLLFRSSVGGAYDRMAHRVDSPASSSGPETGVASSSEDEPSGPGRGQSKYGKCGGRVAGCEGGRGR
jgi:Flp pilus assembly pilin Flp